MYCNLGLTGYPLKHSLSPIIHNFLLYSNKINGGYNCFELIDAKEIGELLKFLRKYHFYGLNITLPYKEEIINYVNDLSDEAKKVKSVNTLYIKNDYIKGYNTDLYGFKQMLTYNSISPYGKTVALIGAGGASRAVLSVLLEENVKEMLLLCRDVNKGYKLINDLNIAHLKNINVKEINYLKNSFECDIIINATSAGINSLFDIELNKIKVNYCAIDLQYNVNDLTDFLKSLKTQQVILIDGLVMLIFQALKSFQIWTERNINISIEEIKNLLKGINEIR